MKDTTKPTIAELIWLFIFGCVLGFVLETLWYFIKNGIWINKQGLLYGPFKPIYGFGLVLIILFMYKLKDKNIVLKFLIGVIIGSAFEYFGSLFQEYIFGTSTWNYSSFNYNISGRLYLPYCLAWGVIAVICLDLFYPFFKKLIAKIPKKLGQGLTIVASVLMIINIGLTALATIRYADRANNIVRNNAVFQIIDNWYPDEYMQIKFPKLKVISK